MLRKPQGWVLARQKKAGSRGGLPTDGASYSQRKEGFGSQRLLGDLKKERPDSQGGQSSSGRDLRRESGMKGKGASTRRDKIVQFCKKEGHMEILQRPNRMGAN